MKKQSYQRILAVLISLMILLTAGMAIVAPDCCKPARIRRTFCRKRRLPRIRAIC